MCIFKSIDLIVFLKTSLQKTLQVLSRAPTIFRDLDLIFLASSNSHFQPEWTTCGFWHRRLPPGPPCSCCSLGQEGFSLLSTKLGRSHLRHVSEGRPNSSVQSVYTYIPARRILPFSCLLIHISPWIGAHTFIHLTNIYWVPAMCQVLENQR